jgi:hypothetical protein
LLEGREVIALTEATATIRNPATGSLTMYQRFNKPSYRPLAIAWMISREEFLSLHNTLISRQK